VVVGGGVEKEIFDSVAGDEFFGIESRASLIAAVVQKMMSLMRCWRVR